MDKANRAVFDANAQCCDIMNNLIKENAMEKINVAELLKYCPSGMELDCAMFSNPVTLDEVVDGDTVNYPITIITHTGNLMTLTKYGTYAYEEEDAKCVIYPKGKTTWEGFVPPSKFKDGDVVRYSDCIAIFKEWGDATLFRTYVTAYLHGDSTIDVAIPLFGKSIRREAYLATEEEKAKLFQAIKVNGYKWNSETKTLEELPKFKVGDRIKHKTHIRQGDVVTEIKDTHYILNDELALPFIFQDEYEVVPNKFDINTLKPFESRVLVRNVNGDLWKPALYGFSPSKGGCYAVGGTYWKQCIPYEGNQHLLGKTDDCDEYFKTWK